MIHGTALYRQQSKYIVILKSFLFFIIKKRRLEDRRASFVIYISRFPQGLLSAAIKAKCKISTKPKVDALRLNNKELKQ